MHHYCVDKHRNVNVILHPNRSPVALHSNTYSGQGLLQSIDIQLELVQCLNLYMNLDIMSHFENWDDSYGPRCWELLGKIKGTARTILSIIIRILIWCQDTVEGDTNSDGKWWTYRGSGRENITTKPWGKEKIKAWKKFLMGQASSITEKDGNGNRPTVGAVRISNYHKTTFWVPPHVSISRLTSIPDQNRIHQFS